MQGARPRQRQTVPLTPDLAADHYKRGNAFVGQKRYGEALACYEAAIALKPDAAEAHSNLGVVFAALNQHEKACTHFRKAVTLHPAFANAHFGFAQSLVALNRPAEAINHYEKVIALSPGHATPRHSLGMLLNTLGRHHEAVVQFKRVLKLDPGDAAAHHNLGTAAHALGRYAEAVGHYRKCIALAPGLAVAYVNLGNSLTELNCDAEALVEYDAALARKADYPEALCRRADALCRLGRRAEALADYEKAIALSPGYVEAHHNLGGALLALGRHDEAILRLEEVLALDEGCADAHSNLGAALKAAGRADEAMAHFTRALELKPDHAEVHVGIGELLREMGRIDEAYLAFETAVERSPRLTVGYLALTECKRFAPDDAHLSAMENMARDMSSFRTSEQIELHFALGKALADTGQKAASHHHFLKGNALKRSTISYDESSTLEFLEHLQEKFTRQVIEDRRGAGHPSSEPIFIVGMPRSGTTLIEQILASHPWIFAAGELRAWAESMKSMPDFEAMLDSPEPGIDPAVVTELGGRYAARIKTLTADAAHVTDKMPANFRFLGLIHLALPNARIIHVRRDPVDTCLSCFTKLFSFGQPFSYDLAELGRYYRAYHELMDRWRTALPENVLLEVRYEDVVDDLEGQARRLVAHCGLDWDAGCLEFHRTQRPVRTASATQVRQPIYKTSVGRWRAYEAAITPLLDALGPELAADRRV